jgi:hypothetical protein
MVDADNQGLPTVGAEIAKRGAKRTIRGNGIVLATGGARQRVRMPPDAGGEGAQRSCKKGAAKMSGVLATALALLLSIAACGVDTDGGASSKPMPSAAATGAEKPAAGVATDKSPTNLLLVTLDTTRGDALGAYGQRLDASPNIDRLATGGVLFEQAVSSSPQTLPSHSTLFTGKYPYVHGVRANSGYVLSEQNITIAEVLRDAGYRTGAEVAALVMQEATQITQGFDHYRGADTPGVKLKRIQY